MSTKKTTADFIILQAERHLKETMDTPQIHHKEYIPDKLERSELNSKFQEFFGPMFFIFGGVIMVFFAFQLLYISLPTKEKVFLIQSDGTQIAEQIFYDAEKIAIIPPENNSTLAHSAASTERSNEIAGALGMLAIIVILGHLNHHHGVLESNRPQFTIRKIQ